MTGSGNPCSYCKVWWYVRSGHSAAVIRLSLPGCVLDLWILTFHVWLLASIVDFLPSCTVTEAATNAVVAAAVWWRRRITLMMMMQYEDLLFAAPAAAAVDGVTAADLWDLMGSWVAEEMWMLQGRQQQQQLLR